MGRPPGAFPSPGSREPTAPVSVFGIGFVSQFFSFPLKGKEMESPGNVIWARGAGASRRGGPERALGGHSSAGLRVARGGCPVRGTSADAVGNKGEKGGEAR